MLSVTELESGVKLGLYTIIRQIGSGGMSNVYLVKDNLQREWALKVLNLGLSTDSDSRKRFEHEATILSRLEHPNIIGIHSYFEEGAYHCLVMKYLDCGSIKDLIRRVGPIVEKRALAIIRQIASALAYAHSQGVIHRDIKPSNLLIDQQDKATVLDFGVSRILGDSGLTQTGSKLGTPSYMSPEQVLNSKDITAFTDVYSLGISFYEMLSGKALYDHDTLSEFKIYEQIVYQPIPDPRVVYPDISEKTINLLVLMTHKDPQSRTSSSEIVSYIDSLDATNGDNTRIQARSPKITQVVTKPLAAPTAPHQTEPSAISMNQSGSEQAEAAAAIPAAAPRSNILYYVLFSVFAIAILGLLISFMSKSKDPDVSGQGATDTKSDHLDMLFVAGGTFNMGDTFGLETEGGLPTCAVTVSSFYMSKTEITQELYTRIMGSNPSYWKDPAMPVQNISWYDAVRFCDRLSLQQGLTPCYDSFSWHSNSVENQDVSCNFGANGYRLPTEAEWEFAARGGAKTKNTRFSGSNDPSSVGWSAENTYGKPMKVGLLRSNEMGLHDLSGNVWEWVWDWYASYTDKPKTNPWGSQSGTMRGLRGGSYAYHSGLCLVSFRSYRAPSYKYQNIGFRIVRSDPNTYSGGSFVELPQATEVQIFPLVRSWNEAHHRDVYNTLRNLYASKVHLYGQMMSSTDAAQLKLNYMNQHRNYYQEVSDLRLSILDDNLLRVRFDKRVELSGEVRTYPSYLEFMRENGDWKISRESDAVTDRNLGINRL